jgi:dynein heavy chain
LASPPAVIEAVCGIAYFLYPKTGSDASWSNIKVGLLSDMKLLNNLKEYEVSKTKADGANRAKKKYQQLVKDLGVGEGDELQALIKSKSVATGGMFKWCSSTLKCYDIYKNVEPLKKKAEKMRIEKETGERELAETEKQLSDLNENLANLNAQKKEKQDELDELQRTSAEMTRKLNAASQLIGGLGSEQKRWTSDMGLIQEDKIKLVGDCLTGSAFLSYCGPFNSVLR